MQGKKKKEKGTSRWGLGGLARGDLSSTFWTGEFSIFSSWAGSFRVTIIRSLSGFWFELAPRPRLEDSSGRIGLRTEEMLILRFWTCCGFWGLASLRFCGLGWRFVGEEAFFWGTVRPLTSLSESGFIKCEIFMSSSDRRGRFWGGGLLWPCSKVAGDGAFCPPIITGFASSAWVPSGTLMGLESFCFLPRAPLPPCARVAGSFLFLPRVAGVTLIIDLKWMRGLIRSTEASGKKKGWSNFGISSAGSTYSSTGMGWLKLSMGGGAVCPGRVWFNLSSEIEEVTGSCWGSGGCTKSREKVLWSSPVRADWNSLSMVT